MVGGAGGRDFAEDVTFNQNVEEQVGEDMPGVPFTQNCQLRLVTGFSPYFLKIKNMGRRARGNFILGKLCSETQIIFSRYLFNTG